MMLQPLDARHPWQRIMLVLESPEIRIENELGETLASATTLPALLDAVDGGVTEPGGSGNYIPALCVPAGFIL